VDDVGKGSISAKDKDIDCLLVGHVTWVTILTQLAPLHSEIRKWADKFCLHCNFFIYIRHIWIKPVLCSRMVSLFHHTSPWVHRCLQLSPSAHRNGRVFRRSVQTACYYGILNRGKISSNLNSQTASRLWWSVCWCEYNKTLGKAVQRWRIGASRFWVTKHEVEGLRLQIFVFVFVYSAFQRSTSGYRTCQLHQDRVEELIRGKIIMQLWK